MKNKAICLLSLCILTGSLFLFGKSYVTVNNEIQSNDSIVQTKDNVIQINDSVLQIGDSTRLKIRKSTSYISDFFRSKEKRSNKRTFQREITTDKIDTAKIIRTDSISIIH
jgi:hypothetical protein